MAICLCANKFSDRHFHLSAKFSSKKSSLKNLSHFSFPLKTIIILLKNSKMLKPSIYTMCCSEEIYT